MVETWVLLIGRGVAYRKMEETDLCWSATVKTGVMFIARGVAYRKTGLHGILLITTVDPLQPPRATVHLPSTCASLHLRLFIHGLLFIQPPPRAPHRLRFNQPSPQGPVQPPLHRLLLIQPSTGYYSTSPLHTVLFNHPSTGYYSSNPPPATVQPALHRLLFNQPSTGSCSSTPNRLDRGPVHPAATTSTTMGSCSSTPTGNYSSNPQQRSLFRRQQV